ncbi:MAG: hypothetical protein ACJ746_09595 [Bryobacteraceae bacterium]
MPTHFPVPPISKPSADRTANRSAQQSVEAFRACHERYNACLQYQNLRTKSFMNETIGSYLLDFDLASKRAIGMNSDRYRLFQLLFLQGHSATEICEQLGIGRFTFASEIAEIEKTAGRAFVQRGLFPLSAYFGEDRSLASERRAA